MTDHAKPAGPGTPAHAGQEPSGGAARRQPSASRDAYVTVMLRLAADGHVPADVSADELLAYMPMNVTRGSLYFHFATMGDLYSAVLARWRQETSSEAIEALQASAMRVVRDPVQRLQLLREWTRDTAARDRAIRQWADRAGAPVKVPAGARAAAAEAAKAAAAKEAKAAVAQADAAIIGYTRSALRDLGYGTADAQALAEFMAPAFTSDRITAEGFERSLRVLRRIAPERAAGEEVRVAAGTDGALVLYEDAEGDPDRRAAAQQFAAGHSPGGPAGQERGDAGGGAARPGTRRSPAANG